MSSNAQRFAKAVLDAFKAAGAYTDKEVGDAGGPSTTTLTTLRKVASGERSSMSEPRSDTLRKIDRAAHWETGSARALWESGASPRVRVGLREVLSGDRIPTPVREQRVRQQTSGGIDQFLQRLADRVLELEERVDLLEESRPSLRAIAHDEEHTIEFEQGHDETP